MELQIPLCESWGLFLLLISHYPRVIDWIALTRVWSRPGFSDRQWLGGTSLSHCGVPKWYKFWALHLLLTCSWAGMEMGKEGACSPPVPPSSSTYSSRDGRKMRENTLGWRVCALRGGKCWGGAMRAPRAALTPPAQPLCCSIPEELLGAQGSLLCLQKSRIVANATAPNKPCCCLTRLGWKENSERCFTRESTGSIWWQQASAQGLHLLAAASSNKANIWCQNEM